MPMTSVERADRRRERLRRAGLRPVQIWVPDSRRPGFAEECRRQAGTVRDSATERDDVAWTEAAADMADWT